MAGCAGTLHQAEVSETMTRVLYNNAVTSALDDYQQIETRRISALAKVSLLLGLSGLSGLIRSLVLY